MRHNCKALIAAMSALILLLATGCTGDRGGTKDDVGILRLTQTNPSTTAIGMACEEFAQLLEERTDGRWRVIVYHDGQLGDERDSVESIQLHNIDFAIVNASVLVNFAPELGVFDLPYVIHSYEHADKVFMGSVGDQANEWVEKIGVKSMGVWESGFRNLTNSVRPITSADDVKGLRIRVMENELHQKLWLQLGADPVPMAWSDAYTALQQGALDGQENPLATIASNNVQEVNNNLAMTEHIYSIVIPIMNEQLWDSLTPSDQEIFQEVFDEMLTREREIARRENEKSLSLLEDEGMTITYPDKEGFIEAMDPVIQSEGAEYRQTLDVIAQLDS